MRMMNEFEAQVLSDLSVLKSQMAGLMGDGNGGRLAELERRMDRHEQNCSGPRDFSPPSACCSPWSKSPSRRGTGTDTCAARWANCAFGAIRGNERKA